MSRRKEVTKPEGLSCEELTCGTSCEWHETRDAIFTFIIECENCVHHYSGLINRSVSMIEEFHQCRISDWGCRWTATLSDGRPLYGTFGKSALVLVLFDERRRRGSRIAYADTISVRLRTSLRSRCVVKRMMHQSRSPNSALCDGTRAN